MGNKWLATLDLFEMRKAQLQSENCPQNSRHHLKMINVSRKGMRNESPESR